VHAESASHGAAPALFKALFLVFVLLVVVAAGYAGWIIIRYWDQVGVWVIAAGEPGGLGRAWRAPSQTGERRP
jgi:hypothetical protein